ncbi:MAG TPA: right-handed parallel beta-helix repeat-containing protein [Phycisphaerae bacterium]|nr:right-handed parallel beta-helix repeat-containing protein [Phycisphaerae bacterium]HRY70371.1 right-handed parallel beta-helix repeat-containing protein [Phycisphaerae bacterium]HSA28088.1 right-handed parallel beta-helix repeat-containing protein [Phycisphaerae bacterium]
MAAGTYRPDRGANLTAGGDRAATFRLLKRVALKGGHAGPGAADPDANDSFVHVSVFSGDLLGNDGLNFAHYEDNSYHVVTGSGTDATAVLDGFTIASGHAGYGQIRDGCGGGLFNDAGSPTIARCTFRLYKSSGSQPTGGAAVFNDYSSNPVIRDRVFFDNVADYLGGGIHCDHGSSPTITDSTFIGNRAKYGGGLTLTGSASLVRGVITGNAGGSLSAGVYCHDSGTPSLADCRITDNLGIGLGVSSTNAVAVTSSLIARNQGGGVYVAGGMLTASDTAILQNSATTGGGGYFSGSACVVRFNHCDISGNTASTSSGGLHAGTSDLIATNCRIVGNTSSGEGGSVSCSSGAARFANCVIADNRSAKTGGGVWCSNASPVLTHCTVTGDTASSEAGGITLINSIFWGNKAPYGPEIAVDYGGTALLASHCDVRGGEDGIWVGSMNLGISWIDHNIDVDPQFLDADGPDNVPGTPDDNLRLAAGSPCVDSGLSSVVAPRAEDLDGNPRLTGRAVDMGAYEQAIVVAPAGPTVVPEGGVASFTVALAAAPPEPITVIVRTINGEPS